MTEHSMELVSQRTQVMRKVVIRHPEELPVANKNGGVVSLLILMILVVLTSACNEPGEAQPQGSSQTDQTVGISLRQPEQSLLDSVSLEALFDSIRVIQGHFVDHQGVYWEFSGNRAVFQAFNRFGDSALVRLVDCLDKTDRVAATANGEPVALGFMCYKALEQVAYYEQDYEDAETDLQWPGIVGANASEEQLIAAKRAWLVVVADRSYILH